MTEILMQIVAGLAGAVVLALTKWAFERLFWADVS